MTSALLPNYARAPLAFERGEGAWLFTRDGQRYLDFGAGVAVNALGHAHPHLVAALQEQAAKVWHVSNLYQIPEGERLGRRFVEATFAEVAFFCNSGAEANEAAIKIARKYHAAGGHPERYRIVTFEGAFHGRTLATLAAGGQQKYIDGFGPKVEGFDQVPTGDFAALEAAIGPETAALMIEPVQGEGGVRVIPPADLRRLRDLCDEHGLLLIMDEVQTGMGRTGKLFAYEWSGIAPDILSAAKGIGGGFPLGACLTTKEAARGMVAGSHGSTFGGNPLAMAVGNAVLDVILSDGFLDRVAHTGLVLKQKLASLRDKHPRVIQEVRGEGLMVGLKLGVPNTEFAAAAREANLLVIPAGDNVVRLIPPLIVTESDVEEAVRRLDAAANGFSALRGAAE
ncbi:aspartate aminotransferase family protein [Methylobacterium sp. J-067]|uniref:aspartate aminotransferase family protein n=1 Tax=Methylobacterium sp. J-067 TaxID=2836648 RepID=UPI001FB89B13|nr:aspartate aminotransferase family protein [Methylobacterium sp. J-067]MCJ2026533.1 aspartate aminotransferase family protein [Methylobacterium sp. J-067]